MESGLSSSEWLHTAEQQLRKAGIGTARLDVLVLLAAQTGREKSWLLAYPERILQMSDVKNLNKKLVQRAKGMPLAYLLGGQEFYGRYFKVSPAVLIPRPESEDMIEMLLATAARNPSLSTIIDIGTGSGCLAVTAKLELPHLMVTASDIDPGCLGVARYNAKTLGAQIEFACGNLLQPIQGMKHVPQNYAVLANLPYVPVSFPIGIAAGHEPALALFSGNDGLDHYRQLFAQAGTSPAPPLFIYTESLPQQHPGLIQLANRAGYALADEHNLIQLFKHVRSD